MSAPAPPHTPPGGDRPTHVVLVGLGAVAVATAVYMIGRSNGARSEYEAQQRAAAAAGYPRGPGRTVPPRRPPPPDWPRS
jgi:hypothetical protein